MSSRIVLLGATGYTGGLVLEALLRRDAKPVLAGRNPAAVAALAERSGGLEQLVVDASDQESLRRQLRRGDVLITTVGPFARFGHPVAQAAADVGAHYLDSTGEVGFVRELRERHHCAAQANGATMLPAFGYDYVPGILAGALAAREAGDGVRALDIGYFAGGPVWRGISEGTRATMRDGLTLPSLRRRRGELVGERTAGRVRRFAVDGRDKSAFLVSGTEVLFLPEMFPSLVDVTVYNGWLAALSRPVSFGAALANAAVRLPGGRAATDAVTGLVFRGPAGGPDAELRARIPSHVVAIASSRTAPLAEVRLDGPNAYSLTGELIAWAATRIAGGQQAAAGVVGPIEAFGLEQLRAGCAELGLR